MNMRQIQPNASAPGKGFAWRPLGKREFLPDLPPTSADARQDFTAEFGVVLGGGGVPGALRCSAVGLRNGDCSQHRVEDSRYCYYHTKLHDGDVTIEDVPPAELYPVWPLPKEGYVLLAAEAAA